MTEARCLIAIPFIPFNWYEWNRDQTLSLCHGYCVKYVSEWMDFELLDLHHRQKYVLRFASSGLFENRNREPFGQDLQFDNQGYDE